VKELMEGDVSQKHHGLIGIRKLVSVVENVEVMIKKVVDSGAIPTLIHLMTQPDHPQLKLEAAWAITNVMTSTGGECELVIKNGGIEGLIHAVRDADTHIGIQGIWGLGNLAADNENHRNLVVEGGGLDAIFDFYQATHV
jgi:importin subunit alpha-1